MAYYELNENKEIILNAEGETDYVIPNVYVVNKNMTTNDINDNYNKVSNILFESTANWITSIKIEKKDNTAGLIKLTYNKNEGLERYTDLKLKNAGNNIFLALRLIAAGEELPTGESKSVFMPKMHVSALYGTNYINSTELSDWISGSLKKLTISFTYPDEFTDNNKSYDYDLSELNAISYMLHNGDDINNTLPAPIMATDLFNDEYILYVIFNRTFNDFQVKNNNNVVISIPAYIVNNNIEYNVYNVLNKTITCKINLSVKSYTHSITACAFLIIYKPDADLLFDTAIDNANIIQRNSNVWVYKQLFDISISSSNVEIPINLDMSRIYHNFDKNLENIVMRLYITTYIEHLPTFEIN